MKKTNLRISGVGGIDNGILYGLGVKEGKIFFIENTKLYEIDINNYICSNLYINVKQREFKIISNGKLIYEIQYHPFLDPGRIYYEVEEDEFDVLLYINSILNKKEMVDKFIMAMEIGRAHV